MKPRTREKATRVMKAVNVIMALAIIYAIFFLWLYWTYQI